MNGRFVISLDFEGYWGMSDIVEFNESKINSYFYNYENTINTLHSYLEKNIKSTWAIVGFLLAESAQEILDNGYVITPNYKNSRLDNYKIIKKISQRKQQFASDRLFKQAFCQKLSGTNNIEIASHTFSHFYCNEPNVSIEDFQKEVDFFRDLLKTKYGKDVKALILPRNQINTQFLRLANLHEITVVRSNPRHYELFSSNILNRLNRLYNSLLPNYNIFDFTNKTLSHLKISPGTRFLRYNVRNEKLLSIFTNAVIKEMTYAARNGLHYHLWWHPHNFCHNLDFKMVLLDQIISHYKDLNKRFGFKAVWMSELANETSEYSSGCEA